MIQCKHFVLAAPRDRGLYHFSRLQVGYYLRNLLTRFTTLVHIARSRPLWQWVVEVVFVRECDWLSDNWCVLHWSCCLSLMYPAMRMT